MSNKEKIGCICNKGAKMKKYFNFIKDNPLFNGMEETEINAILQCSGAFSKKYQKNDIIIHTEDEIKNIGLILNGKIEIIREDFLGNRNIIANLSNGDLFAETFSCAGVMISPVTVVSLVESEVLFFNYDRIITTCSENCKFHNSLIKNMLKILAQRNMLLNSKINLLSQRTIREKLLSYFSMIIMQNKSKKFRIPFSRNQLAEFICVDRSALSRELSKMKEEGLLKFEKDDFELLI